MDSNWANLTDRKELQELDKMETFYKHKEAGTRNLCRLKKGGLVIASLLSFRDCRNLSLLLPT